MRLLAWVAVGLVACSNDTFVSSDGGDDAGQADVSVDAPAPGDGGGGGDACSVGLACSGTETCVTFDPSPMPFTDQSVGSGSTRISDTEAVSCPSSLEADLPDTQTADGKAIVSADFIEADTTSAMVTVDLSVWLPSNANGMFSAFDWRVGNSDTVGVGYDPSGNWQVYAAASGQARPITPATGRWNHMVLTVVFSADTGTGAVSLTYDAANSTRPTASIKDRTATAPAIPTASLELGLAGNTNQAMTAYYDDVIITH